MKDTTKVIVNQILTEISITFHVLVLVTAIVTILFLYIKYIDIKYQHSKANKEVNSLDKFINTHILNKPKHTLGWYKVVPSTEIIQN
jgi:hypothetical protein